MSKAVLRIAKLKQRKEGKAWITHHTQWQQDKLFQTATKPLGGYHSHLTHFAVLPAHQAASPFGGHTPASPLP